jgi:hypothetical protein
MIRICVRSSAFPEGNNPFNLVIRGFITVFKKSGVSILIQVNIIVIATSRNPLFLDEVRHHFMRCFVFLQWAKAIVAWATDIYTHILMSTAS